MRGVHPTHINGHQYVELLPGLRETLRGLMARYGIDRLRIARERGLARTTLFRRVQAANWALAHVKRFYAVRLEREVQAWNVEFPDAFFGTSHAGRIDLPLVRQFLASGRRAADRDRPAPGFHGRHVRQPGRRLERSVGDGSPQGTGNADESTTRRHRQIARHVAGPPGRNGNGGRAQSRVTTMRAFVSSSNRGRIQPTGVPLAGALTRQCLRSQTKRHRHWRPKAAASGTSRRLGTAARLSSPKSGINPAAGTSTPTVADQWHPVRKDVA